MRVIGIDPGTGRLGWAVVDKDKGKESLVICGCIETSANTSLEIRLAKIFTDLNKIITKYKPNEGAVEELFFAKNAKTAISVGHARGVVLLSLSLAGIPVSHYKPAEIKMSVAGHGAADKKQIQQMTKAILGLKELIKPDDAADAVAVALTHFAMSRWRRIT